MLQLARGLHNSVYQGPGSQRTSGVAPPAAQKPGSPAPFLAWLPGARSKLIQTPLSEPLPGLDLGPARRAPTSPPPTEITKLPNGAHIISEASPGPTASIGIYVNSGSIYETPSHSGASALLECLAFKSTTHRNALSIIKEVERVGSTFSAMASREQMSYTMDCLKSSLPASLEVLCDAVLNPALLPQEVEEQKARLGMLLGAREVAMTLLNERLVRAAYTGALSNPLIPDVESLARLSPEVLRSFMATNYSAPRLVLAASGVEHQQLVELATPMLSLVPGGEPAPQVTSAYQGACVTLPMPEGQDHGGALGQGGVANPLSQLIVAWEYPGGWRDVPGAVAMTVLTYLLGGGDSFSSGGPGKGMHSRLYTRVLNHYAWVHSCSAFNAVFNQSGLVGVQAACDVGHASDMLDVMCREMELAARSLSVEEVERAKRTALATICNALESKATSAEDIGRQFLTYNRRISGQQYAAMIEAVTPRDINAFVQKLLESKPSLALHGPGTGNVSYDALLRRYSWSRTGGRQQGGAPGSQAASGAADGAGSSSTLRRVLSGWRS